MSPGAKVSVCTSNCAAPCSPQKKPYAVIISAAASGGSFRSRPIHTGTIDRPNASACVMISALALGQSQDTGTNRTSTTDA